MRRVIDHNQRPLRVLLVISNLEYGGAQRQVIELANAADPATMDIHVCSLSPYVPLGAELRNREQRLHIISKQLKFDASVVPRLAQLIRRLRIDVAQSYLFDAEIATRLAGRLAAVPLVVGSERNTDYRLKRRQRLAYAITSRAVDLVIANSNAGAAFNSRTLRQPPSRYAVVHNGVNTRRFVPGDRNEVRTRLGLPLLVPVVGMFASFKAQKNHPLFLAGAKTLLEKIPATKFLLVGDQLHGGLHGSDAYKMRILKLVQDLGLHEHCVLLGNRDDVHELYTACDLTVLPSVFEGTPNVALESMACGVPVIATDVSDNALVVPDGRTGFIVPLDDPAALAERMWRLLTTPRLRDEMGASARVWVEAEFSPDRLAQKTEAVFRGAIARLTERHFSSAAL